jgi:hypothetical protein
MASDLDSVVKRLKERTENHRIQRARHKSSRAVERIAMRQDGASVTRAPESINYAARSSQPPSTGHTSDMRSRIVRQVVEMSMLDGELGLQRQQEAPIHRAEAAAEDKGDDGNAFDRWYAEMQAQGMGEAEIEEHMTQRIRAMRRALGTTNAERRLK